MLLESSKRQENSAENLSERQIGVPPCKESPSPSVGKLKSPIQSKYNSGSSDQQPKSHHNSAHPTESFTKKASATKLSPENAQYSTPRLNKETGVSKSIRSNQKMQAQLMAQEVTGFSIDDQSQYFTVGDMHQPVDNPLSRDRLERETHRAPSHQQLRPVDLNARIAQETAMFNENNPHSNLEIFYREQSNQVLRMQKDAPDAKTKNNLVLQFDQSIDKSENNIEDTHHIDKTVPKERGALSQRPRRAPVSNSINIEKEMPGVVIPQLQKHQGLQSTGKFTDFNHVSPEPSHKLHIDHSKESQTYSQMYVDSLRDLHAAEISSLKNKHSIEKDQLARQFAQSLREKQHVWQQELELAKRNTLQENESRRREKELLETISNLRRLNEVLNNDKEAIEARWQDEEVEREEYKRDVEQRIEKMKQTFYHELGRWVLLT